MNKIELIFNKIQKASPIIGLDKEDFDFCINDFSYLSLPKNHKESISDYFDQFRNLLKRKNLKGSERFIATLLFQKEDKSLIETKKLKYLFSVIPLNHKIVFGIYEHHNPTEIFCYWK